MSCVLGLSGKKLDIIYETHENVNLIFIIYDVLADIWWWLYLLQSGLVARREIQSSFPLEIL